MLIGPEVKLRFHEDNEAMIRIMQSGRNPTMRHLGRTHGVSINWLHERFKEKWIQLVKEDTTTMCADIFTKAFDNKDTWNHACSLINVYDFSDIPARPRRGDTGTGTAEKTKQQIQTVAVAVQGEASCSAPALAKGVASLIAPGFGSVTNSLPADDTSSGGDSHKMKASDVNKIRHQITRIKWPKQSRPTTKGLGLCLGVTNDPNGPKITKMKPHHAKLVKTINSAIGKILGPKGFKWGSLQINVDTTSTPHKDSNNSGPSAIILMGICRWIV